MADIPKNLLNHIDGVWVQGGKIAADDDAADGELAARQFVIYWDDSAGKLKFKARDSFGFIVEQTITSS